MTAAQLDQAFDGFWRVHDEALAGGLNIDAVVADELCREPARLPLVDEFEGKQRLAGAGYAAQDQPRPAEDQSCGVDVGAGHFRGRGGLSMDTRGSVTVKTAPERSARFSATMVPRCASTICLLMARPRPEWSPKCSPSGRSV